MHYFVTPGHNTAGTKQVSAPPCVSAAAEVDKLRAIAQAAAREVGKEARTIISGPPRPAPPPAPQAAGFKAPPPKLRSAPPPKFGDAAAAQQQQQVAASGAESPSAGANPLAGLLGYGDEDDDAQDLSPAQAAAPQQPQPAQQAGPSAAAAGAKDLDAEVRGLGCRWACPAVWVCDGQQRCPTPQPRPSQVSVAQFFS